MKNGGLISTEKLVLYGIVRFPLLNDRELADRLKMKTSTLTAIRHRLEKREMYRQVRFPFLFDHDVEMLAASFAVYNASILERSYSQMIEEQISDQPEAYWSIRESGQDLVLFMSRNLTDVKRHIEELEQIYVHGRVVLEEVQHLICFPKELIKSTILFNYAPPLKNEFSIGPADIDEREDAEKRPISGDMPALTKTEKRVYVNLVRYPSMTDKWISERSGISRYTIAKAKDKFESEGLLRTLKIPNIKALGFEMLVFAHGKFNLRASVEEKDEMLREVFSVKPPVFLLNGRTEAISIDIYRDFEEFRSTVNRLSMIYREHPIFIREPTRIMFSVPNMKVVQEFSFDRFVEKTLGIRVEKGEK